MMNFGRDRDFFNKPPFVSDDHLQLEALGDRLKPLNAIAVASAILVLANLTDGSIDAADAHLQLASIAEADQEAQRVGQLAAAQPIDWTIV